MNFGKVNDPDSIDFTLPLTHEQTVKVLKKHNSSEFLNVRVGCAKWNKKDLKNFYPKGIKDELIYYTTQFNSIELNASFYRMFSAEQFKTWHDKASGDFQFFPKVTRSISHIKRLNDSQILVDDYVSNLMPLEEKLGMVFLQMPENFHPKNIDRLEPFFQHWPKEIPLGLELRHTDWFQDSSISSELNEVLLKHNITNIITDSAGRRDLLHMRLTNETAFIRFNGANHPSDYTRLDDWLKVIEEWYKLGLKNLYFFVHQNIEEASPLLSAYFIEKLNAKFNLQLPIPDTLN